MTPLHRLPDWRPRLVSFVNSVRARPFAYGTHDCALFAAGAVEAMTGVDLAKDWRGAYSSLKEGLHVLRNLPWSDVFIPQSDYVRSHYDDSFDVDDWVFDGTDTEQQEADLKTGPVALVAHHFEKIPPAFAQIGDIAVIGEVGIPALGVFEGEMILVLREEGLGLMPRAAAACAYRVG